MPSTRLAASRTPLWALFAANAVSNIGNVLTMVAVPWFVLQTTGSASKTGIVAAMTVLPAIIAGIFGGTIVDRTGFRRMSILADLASGLAVAMIPLLNRTIGIHFWELMLLVFLGSLFDAPGSTARQSLLPDLAEMAQIPLERANAVYVGIERGSLLFGPPLAGVLIALLSAGDVLWVDAATFAFSAIAIVIAIPSPSAKPAGEEAEGYLSQLTESFRFVRRDQLILTMLVIVAVVNFLTAPLFDVILPVYAREIFGSSVDLGIMLAGFGAGALAGTVVYGAVGHRLSRHLTFVSAFFLAMIPTWVLAMTPTNLVVTAAALVVAGIASGPINPLLMTIFQEHTPADMRGRTFGMITAIAWIAMPLGMLVSGILIQLVGLRTNLILIATSFAVITVGVVVNPTLRSLDTIPNDLKFDADTSTVAGDETGH